MKFKNLTLMMAVMFLTLSVKADNSNVCGGYLHPAFDWQVVIKTLSGINCFEGKDLKKDYEQVCGCVKNLPKLPSQSKDNMDYFKQRANAIMLANSITSTSAHTKDEANRTKVSARKNTKETTGLLLTALGNVKTTAAIGVDVMKKEIEEKKAKDEKDYRKMVRECGYNVDEYRRMSRIPTFNLMDTDENVIEGDHLASSTLWNQYLQKNPELMAIDVNLPEPRRLDFRKEIMDRMREIRNQNPVAREFSENKVEIKPDGEVIISSVKSNPERALWYQVDRDFDKDGGKLKNILSKYNAESSPRYRELLEKSREILDSGKNGFEPNFMYIAENETLWNLYFKEDSNAATGCGLKTAQDKSSSWEALSCLKNVGGFCALYETSKEKPKPKDLDKVSQWKFGPLLEIEKAVDVTRKEHRAQIDLFCKTQAKMGHVLNKNGKAVNDSWSIDDFKKHFCVDKDVKVSSSLNPTISENELEVACTNNDYPKLQGFYQRMIDGPEYNKMLSKKFSSEEFKNLKIATARNYLKEKSKFDLQTRNIEDNVTEALSTGNPRNAAKLLAASLEEENDHFEALRNLYAGVNGPKTTTPVVSSGIKTPVAGAIPLINPILDPGASAAFNPGFVPTKTVDAVAVKEQQQIVADEGKKIVDTKQQINELVDLKNSLPPTSPQVSEFEKQIQDLRNQLASSEAKYQSAIDGLKKANQPVVAENDKTTTGSPNVQRNIASTPVINNESNVVNSNGTNQGNTSGGSASVSGSAKINNGNGTANAGSTNRALLQANNVDLSTVVGGSGKEYGLVLNTVKNESNEEIGVVADPGVYEAFKKKDMKLYDRYIQEMLNKNIGSLIVRSGDNILYFKLVEDQNSNYSLQEESRVISSEERKYFKKDLTNLLNSSASLNQ